MNKKKKYLIFTIKYIYKFSNCMYMNNKTLLILLLLLLLFSKCKKNSYTPILKDQFTNKIREDFSKNIQTKKLKLALVGCGGRGTGAAIQALFADNNIELVALADVFSDKLDRRLKYIKNKHPKKISKSLDNEGKNKFIGFDAYKKAIDMADVVILATPPGFHPLHFEYAVNNGKHIFMDGPLAVDAFGIRRILKSNKIAEEKKLSIVVGLQRRYSNKYRKIIEQIHDNKIGKIISGQVYWLNSGMWVRERTEEQTELEYQMRNWYYFNWLSGDHIVEQGIHQHDIANWVLGDHPISAQGMGGREIRKGKDHGQIFDHHFIEFTYPSGAIISAQFRQQPGCLRKVNEIFQGCNGSVDFDLGEIKDEEKNNIEIKYEKNDEFQTEQNELFESIRKKRERINDVEYAANSTLTAIMGRMASYSGKVITWEQALNSQENLVPDDFKYFDDDPPPSAIPDENGNYPIPVPGKTKIQ
jgi:myo-inositol 2-dehydrogenase / D-chiro-inositol 1-dehydrogenase